MIDMKLPTVYFQHSINQNSNKESNIQLSTIAVSRPV